MAKNEEERTDWFWRNRFRVAVIVLFVLFINYVPFVPHKPYCFDKPETEFDSHLTEKYFQLASKVFSEQGIIFFTLKNRIFITFGDFLTDPSDAVGLTRNYVEKPIGDYDRTGYVYDIFTQEFYHRFDIWKSIPTYIQQNKNRTEDWERKIDKARDFAYCNIVIALTQKNPRYMRIPKY